MKRLLQISLEWCKKHKDWKRICDIEDSGLLYTQWDDLSEKEKDYWENNQSWWNESGTKKCKVPHGYVDENGKFYRNILNVVEFRHNFMTVYKLNSLCKMDKKISIPYSEYSRILTLVLKSDWYDKIASGKKTHEYREVKPYWTKRIWNIGSVILKKDYKREADSMWFEVKNIRIINGKNSDLKIDKDVFDIELGIKIANI